MNIIYCYDPINYKKVDSCFEEEELIAKEFGFNIYYINYEDLVNYNNVLKATKTINNKINLIDNITIYRGWMLSPEKYTILYNKLLDKKIKLINNPEQYKFCHYSPNNYSTILDHTPKSIYIPKEEINIDNIKNRLSVFNSSPIILKDYVKSQKHYWNKACYIDDSSNIKNIMKIVNNFLELNDNLIEGGLTFKQFEDFIKVENKVKEYRIFILNKKIINTEINLEIKEFCNNELKDIINNIQSNFFSIDLAKRKSDNVWRIIEIGDGQVSSISNDINILKKFYNAILE